MVNWQNIKVKKDPRALQKPEWEGWEGPSSYRGLSGYSLLTVGRTEFLQTVIPEILEAETRCNTLGVSLCCWRTKWTDSLPRVPWLSVSIRKGSSNVFITLQISFIRGKKVDVGLGIFNVPLLTNFQVAVPWCTYFRKVILTEGRLCSGQCLEL